MTLAKRKAGPAGIDVNMRNVAFVMLVSAKSSSPKSQYRKLEKFLETRMDRNQRTQFLPVRQMGKCRELLDLSAQPRQMQPRDAWNREQQSQ